jgi:predicted nucleic acid-binding protein
VRRSPGGSSGSRARATRSEAERTPEAWSSAAGDTPTGAVSSTSGYLADTSVFVAAEQRRALGDPPAGDARISVATLTELGVGVQRAKEDALRTLRNTTLERARRFIALPYDEAVADRLAQLLAAAQSKQRRAGAMDAIIAATALTHSLVIWTQDDDFQVLAELDAGLLVRRG